MNKFILLNSRKLEKQLANAEISEWGKVKYLLVPMVVSILLGGPGFILRPRYGLQASLPDSIANLFGSMMISLVMYLGTKFVYKTNKNIDGKEFVTRYVILSFPITLKFILVGLPMFFIFLMGLACFTAEKTELRNYGLFFLNIIFPIFMSLYFLHLNKSFKRFGLIKKESANEI